LIGFNTLDIKYAELQGKMQKYPVKTMKELEELKVKVSSLENTLSYLPEAVLKQQEEAKARAGQANKKRAGKSKGKGKKVRAHTEFVRADSAMDVNVFPCETLQELQVGQNTGEDESCAICQTDWNAFPSSSFACVLDCEHAFCLKDLCENLKASQKVSPLV
jgi:peroxiredoxin family protein